MEYTGDHNLWNSEFDEAVGPDKILNEIFKYGKKKIIRDNYNIHIT